MSAPIQSNAASADTIVLPEPRRSGQATLEAVMSARRSVRDFTTVPITLAELGQLLWAAQGETGGGAGRTAPSAGATYPLELYAVAGAVGDLPPGIYRYDPRRHAVHGIATGDRRRALAAAALSQSWIADAAVVLVIAAVFKRTTAKYGRRGERYVHIEVGHAGQNVCLQAEALGLGTAVVGAFRDDAVKALIGADEPGEPLCLLPIGRA